MPSDSWKSSFKMASEDPQKILLKVRETWNCPASLSISKALSIHPTNFLRPLFNSQFFLGFNFYISHKTPHGLKTETIRPKLFVRVFLKENICLNCFKEDIIQVYKKTKIGFFVLIEKYIKRWKAKKVTISPAVWDLVHRPAAAMATAGNRR